MAQQIDLEWCNFRNPRKSLKVTDLDLDLGSGQGHISMHNTYKTTMQHDRPCDRSLKQYGNMAIWNSCNIDIPRSLNSRDCFLTRKLENNWAPTHCDLDLDLGSRQGHISMHNKCSNLPPTRLMTDVTLASRSTEIWPIEVRVISTFREVWTH